MPGLWVIIEKFHSNKNWLIHKKCLKYSLSNVFWFNAHMDMSDHGLLYSFEDPLKALVHVTETTNERFINEDANEIISNSHGIFKRVRQSMIWCIQASIKSGEGNFEHLLWISQFLFECNLSIITPDKNSQAFPDIYLYNIFFLFLCREFISKVCWSIFETPCIRL